MKSATFFFSLLILSVSCNSSGAKDSVNIPDLKEEVMAIHDEIMPKMGELRKVEKELKLIASKDSANEGMIAAANTIALANESMMVWMRGYEPNFEGTDEETISYLQDQKVKIQKVKEDMLSSLAEGKRLLQ